MGFYYNTYVNDALFDENSFKTAAVREAELPEFSEARGGLPVPFWKGHDAEIACYWKAWELAFANLKKPTGANGFITNYIATCFNDCLFMWDSVFALMFGKYGRRAFNFQETLDNLYAKQHQDGFICREISETDGSDRFHRFDPSSTGPNVMPWAEWEYYGLFGDKDRLKRVFPVLAAYHRWLRNYRTWPDGTYWSSGWGCGMDNQPRLSAGLHNEFYHGHQSWVDICLQQVFSTKILAKTAGILGKSGEKQEFEREIAKLSDYINSHMWDEEKKYYFDLRKDRTMSDIKSIGAYWALLAGIVPESRLEGFLSHLENPEEFKRPHRVPSLSADTPGYSEEGNYWRGGVWVLTNYMILRGLTEAGRDALAHEIALNHVENVTKVFEDTGTLWENYSPEASKPGIPAQRDFVGFGGLPPIAVLLEYVFGIRPVVDQSDILWDIRLLEEHGVDNYPFGGNGVLSLKCKARHSAAERPEVEIASNIPVTVRLRWDNGSRFTEAVIKAV